MYRILVCDDERVIREGIIQEARSFPDIEISMAENGREALTILAERQIDGIILDVCMPQINGIDVLREMAPNDMVIIILSGYDEFEYAQAAMACGASEYILKPITPRRVREAIQTLLDRIKKRRALHEKILTLTEQLNEIRPAIRDRFFQDMLDGKITKERITNTNHVLGFSETEDHYRVVLISVAMENKEAAMGEEYQLKLLALGELLEKRITEGALFHISTALFALLLTGEEMRASLITELEELEEMFQKDYKTLLRVGIGNPVGELRYLNQSYSDARQALFYAEADCGSIVVSIGDIKTNANPTSFRAERENIITQIRYQNIEYALSGLKRLWEQQQEEEKKISFDTLQLLCINSIMTALGVLEEVCGNLEEYYRAVGEAPIAVLADQRAAQDLLNKTQEYLMGIDQHIKANTHRKNRAIIEKSKELLRLRCCETIGVGDIAEALCFSKNYFGQLFKSETGMTVNEYLNFLRVDRAKKLLRETNLKIYEIAYQTGFSDHFYFSIVFKKIIGISPKEYREM